MPRAYIEDTGETKTAEEQANLAEQQAAALAEQQATAASAEERRVASEEALRQVQAQQNADLANKQTRSAEMARQEAEGAVPTAEPVSAIDTLNTQILGDIGGTIGNIVSGVTSAPQETLQATAPAEPSAVSTVTDGKGGAGRSFATETTPAETAKVAETAYQLSAEEQAKIRADAELAAGIKTSPYTGGEKATTPDLSGGAYTPAQVNGVGTKIATTATTATGTTGTTQGATGTATLPSSADYINQLQNMTFQYDVNADEEYKSAAVQLENEVAQMMVGRGGLYSSVAQSALQSRLIDLQATYRKSAYEQFQTDREFTYKMATYMADREDAAFTQQMQIANYNLEAQQASFDQQYKNAQLRISQANAAYSRQAAAAAQQTADNAKNANMLAAVYQTDYSDYSELISRWQSTGIADSEVAYFFGVEPGTDLSSQEGLTAAATQNAILAQTKQNIVDYAMETKDAALYLNAINDWQSSTSSETTPTTSTQGQTDQYYNAVAAVENQRNAGMEYSEIYTNVVNDSSTYISSMGYANYQNLIKYLQNQST